jgi:hypothetical protein
MLIARAADSRSVLSRLFRFTAFACCALVVASFAMFARDQMAGASAHQQTELVAGPNASSAAGAQSTHHAQPRRFIDSAAHALTTPFAAIIESSNQWVKHGLPALLAVLVYGIGLGYLARYAAVRS